VSALQVAVVLAGLVAEMAGWWLVSAGRADVWRLMPLVLGAMGVAAVLVRPSMLTAGVEAGEAVAVGAGVGAALYVATRAFVWAASHWARFRRDVIEKYQEASTVTLARSLVLSLLVMVPAEELFWRGLTQAGLGEASGSLAVAAVAAWTGYVLANLPSRSLPIVAGAVVGGAVWTALAWWSGGVLAPLASHILWTGSMLALPPGAGRKGGAG
jgi:membrane protease YdiL (CAAX protease family)